MRIKALQQLIISSTQTNLHNFMLAIKYQSHEKVSKTAQLSKLFSRNENVIKISPKKPKKNPPSAQQKC
jgi:hypothetical protein